ncbi:MAG TPA: SDR family oxidoreductase [Gemmatales bacterium]|nr:SDR family oxidoreductase [Gemmatales bacterium]HMP58175.1 SDR family oxidoreductase [Gemmatales bacterium]
MTAAQLFDLKGKVALITGGSKGIGLALARGLARAGADIVICSRKEDELQAALAQTLVGTERRGRAIVADLSRRSESHRLAAEALAAFGRIDILINNAGYNKPQAIDCIQDTDWDALMEVNLHSAMVLSRAVAPGMKERRWGRIVHVASTFAFVSKEARDCYSATKAALVGLARPMAIDLGPFNVTVNCIAPGPILTDLPMSLLSDMEKKAFSDHTALGRWGQPEELVGPVLMLVSDAGSYITGTTLAIDGGYLVR